MLIQKVKKRLRIGSVSWRKNPSKMLFQESTSFSNWKFKCAIEAIAFEPVLAKTNYQL